MAGDPRLEELIAGAGAMGAGGDPRMQKLLGGGAEDPRMSAIMNMMAQQQGAMPPAAQAAGAPMMAGAQQTMAEPTDEEMLDTVSNSMGKRTRDDIPKGDLKWESLSEDRAILEEKPTPQNIASFSEYWGEDKLPKNLEERGEPAGQSEESEGETNGRY